MDATDSAVHQVEPQRWANWHVCEGYVELEAGGDKFIKSNSIVEVKR